MPDQIASYRYERNHPLKGFVIEDQVGPLEEDKVPTCTGLTESMPIPKEQEKRLYELLDYLKENEQQALFIVSPYNVGPEAQMMFNYMKPIIASYGYEFVNMNEHYEEMGIDFATDYYDFGGHVNALGAEKCTAYLGELLSMYDLPDRRNSEGYDSWQEAYDYYLEVSGQALKKIEERIANGDYAVREE